MNLSNKEIAVLLIANVNDAILRGYKHYDKNGRHLESTKEVIEAMQKDGVRVETPQMTPLFTVN